MTVSKCENCIHYDVCEMFGNVRYREEHSCRCFKAKSLFVELPCKVGITLYFLYNRPHADKPDLTPKIYETTAWYFDVDEKGISILPRFVLEYNSEFHYRLNKNVFLDREEAEKKLKEMG